MRDGSDGGPGLIVAIGSKPKGADMSEDCVPLNALAMPDETEQMQNPEPGDAVQYTVEGKIDRIEGDNAYVTREAINGQPVTQAPEDQNQPENPAQDQADNDESGYGELEQQAKGMQLP